MIKKLDLVKTYWYWELNLSSNYRAYKKTNVCEVKILESNNGMRTCYYVCSLDGKIHYRSLYITEDISFLYETKEDAIEAWNEYIQLYINRLTEFFESKSDYLKRQLIQSPVKKIKRGTSENP